MKSNIIFHLILFFPIICLGGNENLSTIDTVLIPFDTIYLNDKEGVIFPELELKKAILPFIFEPFHSSLKYNSCSPYSILALNDILPKSGEWNKIQYAYYTSFKVGELSKYGYPIDAEVVEFPFANDETAIIAMLELDKNFYHKSGGEMEEPSYYFWFRIRHSVFVIETYPTAIMNLIFGDD